MFRLLAAWAAQQARPQLWSPKTRVPPAVVSPDRPRILAGAGWCRPGWESTCCSLGLIAKEVLELVNPARKTKFQGLLQTRMRLVVVGVEWSTSSLRVSRVLCCLEKAAR
jgi:hypothetical protein